LLKLQLKPLSTNEGGLIVDSRYLSVNVLKDIVTFSEDYKNQIRAFIQQNNIGESINDFLSYAKNKGIQIYPIAYMDLLAEVGKKLQIEKISKLSKMINVLSLEKAWPGLPET